MKKKRVCTGYDDGIVTRRDALRTFGHGIGSIALASLLSQDRAFGAEDISFPNFAPKAKRVIFLFQAGAPSQMDLFDYKPRLNKDHGKELPAEVRMGQRLTGMSGYQASLPLVRSPFKFKQQGESGHWMSDLLPHCLLYTSPSPRDKRKSRMPSSA